jgi:uncharacterized protein (DUF169 family)
MMSPEELSDSLCSIEALKRKPIAIKFVHSLSEIPKSVKRFGQDAPEGKDKSLLCAMWGDAFKGAGPFYTLKDQQICGGGALAAGFGSTMPIEVAEKFMIGDGKIFGTMEGLKCALEATHPFKDGEFEAQIIGPLSKMNTPELKPDLVFIICSPAQGQRILRSYGFDTGEFVNGVAGGSTCEMISSYVYKTNRPTFTLGDIGGNTGMMFGENELMLAYPYDQLEISVKNLNRICRVSTMHKHKIHHEQ